MKMYQMHHQLKDGSHVMVEQIAIRSDVELAAWQEFVKSINLLPEGARWILVDENCPEFVKAVKEPVE